jgi:hypothetical protein
MCGNGGWIDERGGGWIESVLATAIISVAILLVEIGDTNYESERVLGLVALKTKTSRPMERKRVRRTPGSRFYTGDRETDKKQRVTKAIQLQKNGKFGSSAELNWWKLTSIFKFFCTPLTANNYRSFCTNLV